MNGTIFIDSEGQEVEIIAWGTHYINYRYVGTYLTYFTPKNKFLKEFNPKEEE